jgi:hypothetical protein
MMILGLDPDFHGVYYCELVTRFTGVQLCKASGLGTSDIIRR